MKENNRQEELPIGGLRYVGGKFVKDSVDAENISTIQEKENDLIDTKFESVKEKREDVFNISPNNRKGVELDVYLPPAVMQQTIEPDINNPYYNTTSFDENNMYLHGNIPGVAKVEEIKVKEKRTPRKERSEVKRPMSKNEVRTEGLGEMNINDYNPHSQFNQIPFNMGYPSMNGMMSMDTHSTQSLTLGLEHVVYEANMVIDNLEDVLEIEVIDILDFFLTKIENAHLLVLKKKYSLGHKKISPDSLLEVYAYNYIIKLESQYSKAIELITNKLNEK